MKKQQLDDATDHALTPALHPQIPKTQARVGLEKVFNNNIPCGATTRSGAACCQPAMANGKCYKHGGRSLGKMMARPENRNARKHGAYSSFLETEADRFQYESFINDIFRVHKNLNRTTDLPHVKIAAMAFVRLWKALAGDASGSTIDDLSRMFCRHCAALKINRDQRPVAREDGQLPRSAAEYAVQIVEQMKANKAEDQK